MRRSGRKSSPTSVSLKIGKKKIEDLAANADERAAVLKKQAQISEQLRRLTQLYKDLLIEERDYQESRARLQT